jgi:hypothetical protein
MVGRQRAGDALMNHHRVGAVAAVSAVITLCGAVLVGVVPLSTASAAPGCATSHPLDLNGDGYDDAVVGDPYATVAGKAGAGSITVLFGDADGRIGEGKRATLNQGSFPGSAVEAGDHFGWAVATGDMTADTCRDILVGSPGEDWNGNVDAGIAHRISWRTDPAGGPAVADATVLTQATTGGTVEAGDAFGSSVALVGAAVPSKVAAIGAPGENLGAATDAGVVNLVGLDGSGHSRGYQLQQGKNGVPGTAQFGDRFGTAVVLTPMHLPPRDRPDDYVTGLIVGVPGDMVGGHDNAGSIAVVAADSYLSTHTGHAAAFTQSSPGVEGTVEAGDHFGFSVASGGVVTDPETRHDIAVGSPGEDIGAVVDAGAVYLFSDHPGGVWFDNTFSQDSRGVPGAAETGDRFGQSVAIRPVGTAFVEILAVSAPFDDIGTTKDAGLVQLFSVDGEATMPGQLITQNSAGVPGTVTANSLFGSALAAMRGTNEDVLAMSSPHQGAGSVFVQSVVGSTLAGRGWVPGAGGIPSTGASRFGSSIAGLNSF